MYHFILKSFTIEYHFQKEDNEKRGYVFISEKRADMTKSEES